MWRLHPAVASAAAPAAAAVVSAVGAAAAPRRERGSCVCAQNIHAAKVLEKKEVASTQWLTLQTLTYVEGSGRVRKYDTVKRSTSRKMPGTADAVAAFAILRRPDAPDDPEVLLVLQFRPPLNRVTVELPAGLIDPGESPEVAAVREMKEETGYTGRAVSCSAPLALSPGLTDESMCLVMVEVDLGAPENQNVIQDDSDARKIEVRRVPLRRLLPELWALEAQGITAFAPLYNLAHGMQLAQSSLG